MRYVPCLRDSILRLHSNPPLSPGSRRRPSLRPHARRGSTLGSARGVPQEPPPNYTDDLARPKADECARETRDADERIYRIDGLRDVRDGAIRKDDGEVNEDFRGDDGRGEEVDGDGDDDQEGREEGQEDVVEEPNHNRKS